MYLGAECLNLYILLNHIAALLVSNFSLVFFVMMDNSGLLRIYHAYIVHSVHCDVLKLW